MFYGKRVEPNGSTTLFMMQKKPSFKVLEISESEYNKLKEELYPTPEPTEEDTQVEDVPTEEVEYTDTLQNEDK